MALTKVIYYTDTSNNPCLYKAENGSQYVLMNDDYPYWEMRYPDELNRNDETYTRDIDWDKLLSRDTYDAWKKQVILIKKQFFYDEILDDK